MSGSKKKRFIIVGGIIVIVVIVAVAFLSAGTTATVMNVSQATAADAKGKKVQVEGVVVDDSYSIKGDVLTFQIVDSDNKGNSNAPKLNIYYDKGVAATFGNGVSAICTGTIDSDGVLKASELITKCPSKYETSNDALTVSRLLNYGADIIGKPVKVTGTLSPGSLADVSAKTRFVLSGDDGKTIDVTYTGAMPDGVKDGSVLVITGSLSNSGKFDATDVAIAETGK